MKLYGGPGMCSMGCHGLLEEIGIQYTFVNRVDVPDATYKKIHWSLKVPALELEDGSVLTENIAILSYLSDLKPELGLMGHSALERAKITERLSFLVSELAPTFLPLFKPLALLTREDAFDDLKAVATKRMTAVFHHINTSLEGKAYTMGAKVTAPDFLFHVIGKWAEVMKISMRDFKNVRHVLKAIQERDSVQKAFKNEGVPLIDLSFLS